jgi:hypothetical protein
MSSIPATDWKTMPTIEKTRAERRDAFSRGRIELFDCQSGGDWSQLPAG